MNILLVNPPNENAIKIPGVSQIIFEEHNFSPPLGLMYVESYLRKVSNIQARIYNFQEPDHTSFDNFKEELLHFQPRIIGITATIVFWYDVLQTAKNIKKILPASIVVLGGNLISQYPDEIMSHKEIDIIVHGEGEITFSELVKTVTSGNGLMDLKGIWYKHNGEIIKNPPRKKESNPDIFPFPDHKKYNFIKHRVSIEENSPSATLISSRGCPHHCSFCSNSDHFYRNRSVDNIIDEILECKEAGYRSVSFYDDNFSHSKEHVEKLCKELINRKIDMPWNCRVRVDGLDTTLMSLMKQAGCQRLHVGVESGSQNVLDSINKGITTGQIRKFFKSAREAGITTLAYVILGLPMETKDDISKTKKFVFEIDPDYLHCMPLIPVAGSKIYNDALDDPNFGGDYFKEYVLNPYPDLTAKHWSVKLMTKYIISEIHKLYVRFYFRPKHIYKNIINTTDVRGFLIKAKIAVQLLFKR